MVNHSKDKTSNKTVSANSCKSLQQFADNEPNAQHSTGDDESLLGTTNGAHLQSLSATVDNRESLVRLRKAYRQLFSSMVSDAPEATGPEKRLATLCAIISIVRLWRWSGKSVIFPGCDKTLTRADLVKLPEQELESLVEQSHNFLSFRVPAGQISRPCGNYVALLKLVEKHSSELEPFESRVSGYFYQFFSESDRKRAQTEIESGGKKTGLSDLIAFTQIYTPDHIVDFLLATTLGSLVGQITCDSSGSGLAATEQGKYANAIENITLIDPACGSGHFLLRSFDAMFRTYLAAGTCPEVAVNRILSHNIAGADVDEVALWICGTELLARAMEIDAATISAPRLANVSKGKYPPRDGKIDATVPGKIKARGLKSPALVGGVELGSLERSWPAGHVLASTYDVVVTNPPYLGRRLLDRRMKESLKSLYPESHHDLSAAFVQRALELLREGGRLGFITQASIMYLPSYADLRKRILENNHIVAVAEIGRGAFPLETGEKVNSVLLVIEKTPPTESVMSNFVDIKSVVEKNEVLDQFSAHVLSANVSNYLQTVPDAASTDATDSTASNLMPKSNSFTFIARRQHEFRSYDNYALSYSCPPFLSRMLQDSEKLGTICDIRQGLATSDNSRFLRYWWDVPRNQLGKRWRPYVKGAGDERWWAPVDTVVDWGNNGESIKEAVSSAYPYLNGKTHWVVKNEQFYFRPGLSFSFISTNSFAGRILPAGCIFDVAGSSLFPPEHLRSSILAWMNSSFATLCARTMNPTVNMQVGDLRKLPVIVEAFGELNTLADQACELKRCLLPGHLDYFSRESVFMFPENGAPASTGILDGSGGITLFRNVLNSKDPSADLVALNALICERARRLENVEHQIDEIVLSQIVKKFRLDHAQSQTLQKLSSAQASRRKPFSNIMDPYKLLPLLISRVLAQLLVRTPVAILDSTLFEGRHSVFSTVLGDQSIAWLEQTLGRSLWQYLCKDLQTELSSLYRGVPPLVVFSLAPDKAIVMSPLSLRDHDNDSDEAVIDLFSLAMGDSLRGIRYTKFMDAILSVRKRENWSSSDILVEMKRSD